MRTKTTIPITMLLSLLCLLAGCTTWGGQSATVRNVQKQIASYRVVIHACGEIADENGEVHQYTNSLEALSSAYDAGNRVVEVDFRFTADNELVCIYDWRDLLYQGSPVDPDYPLDYQSFLSAEYANGFRPLTGEDLASFMREHDDLLVITDIKGPNKEALAGYLTQHYPDLAERFVVQIYHAEEYEIATEGGILNIIYTLYNATEKEKEKDALLQAAKEMDLVGFALWGQWADDPALLSALQETGVPLYVHTIDDEAEISRYLEVDGIDAVYTNRTDLAYLKAE